MPLTDSGTAYIASLISVNLSSSGFLGVGDSTTAFATTQTDLLASTNKLRKVFDATFPTVSGQVITCQTTFATTEANFAWQEWGTFTLAAAGTMLNRKVESLGTKTSSQSWQLQISLSLTD